mmetsp:Transcript_35268/g.77183  ORF Transcript_35268/g.77183 Transcript_35268/m.77183 type:complete len:699 (+) Transcript_35268:106-2202(+)
MVRVSVMLVFAGVCSASKGFLTSADRVSSDAASILSSLLRRLESSRTQNLDLDQQVSSWCTASKALKNAVIETLEHKTVEANTYMLELDADLRRLTSEVSLIEQNLNSKQAEIETANATQSAADQEYGETAKDSETVMEATHHALWLVSAAAGATNGAPHTSQALQSLLDLTPEELTENDKHVMSSFTQKGSSEDDGSERREQLKTTLTQILKRLEDGRTTASQQMEQARQAYDRFVADAKRNSQDLSLQARNLKVEAAEQRRAKARFAAEQQDLVALLQAAKDIRTANEPMCGAPARSVATRVNSYIVQEIEAARTVLESTSPDSAGMFLQAVGQGPTSFFQVDQMQIKTPVTAAADHLRKLAKSYKSEAAWYLEAVSSLSQASREIAQKPALMSQKRVVKQATQAAAKKNDDDDGVMSEIADFATKDDEDVEAIRDIAVDPREEAAVKQTYGSMLSHLQEKKQQLIRKGQWCRTLNNGAQADGAEAAKSLEMVQSKLSVFQGAIQRYVESTNYSQSHLKLLEKDSAAFQDLADAESRDFESTRHALSDFGRQLFSLSTELQSGTEDARRNSRVVQSLVQRIEAQGTLYSDRHGVWQKWASQVKGSLDAISSVVTDITSHNSHRIQRLKSEGRFLKAVQDSRQSDSLLATDFSSTLKQVCPESIESSITKEMSLIDSQMKDLNQYYTEHVGTAVGDA